MVSDHALGGKPHGNAFQAACLRLGVAEWARLASGELPQQIPSWRDKLLSKDEERLLKRAEKLLALAASTNEYEATLAMRARPPALRKIQPGTPRHQENLNPCLLHHRRQEEEH